MATGPLDTCRNECPFSRQEWEAKLAAVASITESHQSVVIERLDGIAAQLAGVHRQLEAQNGRVNKLELALAIAETRGEERSKSVEHRAADRAAAARLVAGVIATIISLFGLALQWAAGRG